MLLCFIRHGIAEHPSAHVTDAERALTSEGVRAMECAAAGIARLRLGIGGIVTSPLVRARQTAGIVGEALGLDRRISVAEELDGRFCLAGLQRLLAGRPEERALALVGHEPTFSITVADLIGGGDVEIKKGSLAVVETERAEPGAGVLRMLLPPSVLRELGGRG